MLAISQLASSAALVTDPNDARSWQGATVGTFASLYYGSDTPANRQLVVDNQLLDDGLFDFGGATAATLIVAGNQGTGHSLDLPGPDAHDGTYDYLAGGAPGDVANFIDEKWIQTLSTVGGTVWDLGAPATKAAVFPTIDHGPLPNEAIESTVYLSNDQITWTPAVVERVWLEGWQPELGIVWDGFVYAVGTGTAATFRYASVTHGGPGALQRDGDDEINGIMGLDADFTPTPDGGSTFLMTSAALLGLGAMARRKRS